MIRFVVSAMLLPAFLAVWVTTPLGTLCAPFLFPSKNSNLPPVEFLPFLALVVVGVFLAMGGRLRASSPRLFWIAIAVNAIYGALVLYGVYDVWCCGRV